VLVETALLLLAVGVLGLWLLSVVLDDREVDHRCRAPRGPTVRDLHTVRVRYVETIDEFDQVCR
jgi:hypothetical protein